MSKTWYLDYNATSDNWLLTYQNTSLLIHGKKLSLATVEEMLDFVTSRKGSDGKPAVLFPHHSLTDLFRAAGVNQATKAIVTMQLNRIAAKRLMGDG